MKSSTLYDGKVASNLTSEFRTVYRGENTILQKKTFNYNIVNASDKYSSVNGNRNEEHLISERQSAEGFRTQRKNCRRVPAAQCSQRRFSNASKTFEVEGKYLIYIES